MLLGHLALTYTKTNCAALWCSSFSGADMESRTSMRFTPLLAGIRYTKPKPVLLLLSRGANVMARDKRRHYNALLWAVEIQNLEILKVCIYNCTTSKTKNEKTVFLLLLCKQLIACSSIHFHISTPIMCIL